MHDDSSAEFVAASVSSIYLLERDGPDLLYYLAKPDDYAEDVQRDYNLSPFYDLYAIEETSGSAPVLVAEQVCVVEIGDFGVVYWQYKRSDNEYDYGESASFVAIVGIYHSPEGLSYTYVNERLFVQQFGG